METQSPTPKSALKPTHNCLDYLRHYEHTNREMHGCSHGPAEVTHEEWYICEHANGGCGARYDPEEVAEMNATFFCIQCQAEKPGHPAPGHDDLCVSCAASWVQCPSLECQCQSCREDLEFGAEIYDEVREYAAPGSIDLIAATGGPNPRSV